MLCRLFALAAVLATAVLADQPAQNSGVTPNEAAGGDVPPGVVMTSVQDILLQPTSSSIANNNVAIGNNVLVSKSNVAVAAGKEKERLAQEIEDLVLSSDATNEGNTAGVISDLIGPTNPKSSGENDVVKGAVQEQIRSLFVLRSDPMKLRGSIIALIGLVSVPSPSPTPSTLLSTQTSEGLATKSITEDKTQTEQFFGYRVLFRYSWGSTWHYGWRYPLPYWNFYGAALYPGGCGFGVAFGPYFYC